MTQPKRKPDHLKKVSGHPRSSRYDYSDEKARKAKSILAKGFSRRVAAGDIGIDSVTFCAWILDYPYFKECVDEGTALGEKKYIQMLQDHARGKKGNSNAVIFLMTNLYRWSTTPKDEIANTPIQINFSLATPEMAALPTFETTANTKTETEEDPENGNTSTP